MSKLRPYILSIGGFDPSGGAGILADIKTFEQHKLLGLAVNTANTIQNEDEFLSVNWLSEELIISQLKTLANKYKIDFVKIGLIPSYSLLKSIRETTNCQTLLLDPIFSASAGYDFKTSVDELMISIDCVDILTPNWEEIQIIYPNTDPIEASKKLSEKVTVYLKGGHNSKDLGKDYLFQKGQMKAYRSKTKRASKKHGSGCVFSSALLSNLAKGKSLHQSCLKAKQYISKALDSNTTKLSYHK
ncbi:MAG: hydroxymethylpyrimidine/phosphomethylpyrimidine kinase [Bacteroidia bacterium]